MSDPNDQCECGQARYRRSNKVCPSCIADALDAAEAKLAAIDRLHQRSDERRRWDLSLKPIPHCSFDGEPWPCDTYRILHSKDDT